MQSRPPSAGLPQAQPSIRLFALAAGPCSSPLVDGRETNVSGEALFRPFARPGVDLPAPVSSVPFLDARLGILGTREPVVILNRMASLLSALSHVRSKLRQSSSVSAGSEQPLGSREISMSTPG